MTLSKAVSLNNAFLCVLCTVKTKWCITERTNPHLMCSHDGSFRLIKDLYVLYASHWCKPSYLALLHVKLFPTLWHSAALGLNREARCAPRMRVCEVPISEYTVTGLPEDPYLTFRLQVVGHFSAQPSSAQLLTLLLLNLSITERQILENIYADFVGSAPPVKPY